MIHFSQSMKLLRNARESTHTAALGLANYRIRYGVGKRMIPQTSTTKRNNETADLPFFARKCLRRYLSRSIFLWKNQADMAPYSEEKFGHYQCNSALSLAKTLQQNPRAIAQKIVEKIDPQFLRRLRSQAPASSILPFLLKFLSTHLARATSRPFLRRLLLKKKEKIDRRVLFAECRKRDARRPYPLDDHRRLPRASLRIPRARCRAPQPHRRLGNPFGMLIAYMKELRSAEQRGDASIT